MLRELRGATSQARPITHAVGERPLPALPRRCGAFRRRSLHHPFPDPGLRLASRAANIEWRSSPTACRSCAVARPETPSGSAAPAAPTLDPSDRSETAPLPGDRSRGAPVHIAVRHHGGFANANHTAAPTATNFGSGVNRGCFLHLLDLQHRTGRRLNPSVGSMRAASPVGSASLPPLWLFGSCEVTRYD